MSNFAEISETKITKFVIETDLAAKLPASPVLLGAGGKPSTRFPPRTLVELSDFENFEKIEKIENSKKFKM